MPKRDPSKYMIERDAVRDPKTVISNAAAAVQRGEYKDPTHAAHTFLNDYYRYDVSARSADDKQYDRKVRYLAGLIKALIRRS